jgi:hypothetical protein
MRGVYEERDNEYGVKLRVSTMLQILERNPYLILIEPV